MHSRAEPPTTTQLKGGAGGTSASPNLRPSYAPIHHLALIWGGGDGWESNPPRTPQQRPANGFEDRGEHQLSNIPSIGNAIRSAGCQRLRPQGVPRGGSGGRRGSPAPYRPVSFRRWWPQATARVTERRPACPLWPPGRTCEFRKG